MKLMLNFLNMKWISLLILLFFITGCIPFKHNLSILILKSGFIVWNSGKFDILMILIEIYMHLYLINVHIIANLFYVIFLQG